MKSPFKLRGIQKTWDAMPGDTYEITGVDCYGKRFKRAGMTWAYCQACNIWCGTRWLRRNGKRHKIQEVFN